MSILSKLNSVQEEQVTTFCCRIKRAQLKRVKQEVKKRGITLTELIDASFQTFLDECQKETPKPSIYSAPFLDNQKENKHTDAET